MNFSILSEHLDDAKNFFQIDIMDVPKKVDDEIFVDKPGKVSLQNSFSKQNVSLEQKIIHQCSIGYSRSGTSQNF